MADDDLSGGVDVDRIWRALGPWGKYQCKQLFIYMLTCFGWVIHLLSIVFIGYRPEFSCRSTAQNYSDVENVTNTWKEIGECSVTSFNNVSGEVIKMESGCDNGWEYTIPAESSFVTEWNFVCENEELAELSQSVMTFGIMVGSLVCPALSDRFGRKPVTVITHVLVFLTTFITTFSTDFYMFIVMRVLTGTVLAGPLCAAILSLETFPKEYRIYTEVFALGVWTLGICAMSPIAYALRNVSWRYLQLTYSLLSAWSLVQWWVYDESLRWLFANGKIDKAKEIIKRACKWNKVKLQDVLDAAGLTEDGSGLTTFKSKQDHDAVETDEFLPAENGHVIPKQLPVHVEHYTILDIFRHAALFRISIIVWFIWFADSLIYFGLFMISTDLYGDRFVNFLLSALCEFPAVVYEFFALNMIGRKWTIITCHAIAAVGLTVATALTYTADGDSAMMTTALVFTLLGKVGITGAFSSSYVTTAELYPTNLRNVALGVSALIGKVGLMVAPFLRNISSVALWLPGCIFSCLCVIVLLVVPLLPETNDVVLPDTIEELRKMKSYNKLHYSLKFRFKKWQSLKNKPTA